MKILVPIDASAHSKEAVQFVLGNPSFAKATVEFLTVINAIPTPITRYLSSDQIAAFVDEESRHVWETVELADVEIPHATMTTLIGDPVEVITNRVVETLPDMIIMGARGMSNVRSWLLGSVSRGVLSRTSTPILLLRGTPPEAVKPMKVGIAVDGSEYGARAAQFIVDHPEIFGTVELHLIYVTDNISNAVVPSMVATNRTSVEENLKIYAQPWQEHAAATEALFKDNGIPYIRACLAGSPGEEIAGYAEMQNLDLLVMGSHGYGNFSSLFLGSTTLRVGALCEKPLLIIR